MTKKYNVGIIGYGWAATAHIAAINATTQGRVAAVWSSRPLDSAELSAKHGGTIKAYRELDAMLADPDIHVVDVTSYPSQHRDQAVAAAKAKKHVILEKPMANTPEEVRDIVAAAEANGVKGCVCFECRYSNQFQVTKALLDEGLLGKLHYGEVDYYHGIGPWYGQYRWNTGKKDGGSALLTAGCHALDALLMLMGNDVASVTSLSTKSASDIFKPYEYDTSSVTILHFKNGAIGKTPEAERRLAELSASGRTPTVSDADFRDALPDAYTKPERTTLKQTVGAGGGTVDLQLDSTTGKKSTPQPRR